MQTAVLAFDVTARKFHQVCCIVLLGCAFVVGPQIGSWLVGLVGVVMAGGRIWWPLDIFRQLVWRVLEPAELLRRRDAQEDHQTRRVARLLGGILLLAAAALLGAGSVWSWVIVGGIGVMIFLDAAFDYCVLCTLNYQVAKLRASH